MNRIEFCKKMTSVKERVGITTTDVSFDMRMQWSTLKRFEKGVHNFSLIKVMEYLKVLRAQLVIYNDEITVCFAEYSQIPQWLPKARAGKFSQRSLADAVGMSQVMLARVESRKSNLTIDVFLKVIEALGYSVDIKPIATDE